MNLGEAKAKALSLMAEYSIDGIEISAAENADYLNRMNRFADTSQKEIAQVKKIPAVKYISQNMVPNQLGQLYAFELKQKRDTDLIETAVGSKAYYFEVDNLATIYIEERTSSGWVVLKTITNTTKNQFAKYKGLIQATNPSADIRIRFSGPYIYNTKNRCLYAYPFPSDEDVPEYSPYVKYEMPIDFMELQKVIHVKDSMAYGQMIDYYWETKRTFVANYFHNGSFQIHYFRYPQTITKDTPDTYEFEVDIEAQELIPFFLGARALMDENQTLAIQLMNEYQTKLSRLYTPEDFGITTITQNYVM
jgi:hypothetical protein